MYFQAPSDETKDKEEGKKKEDKVDEKVSPKISKDAPPNDQAPITEYFVKYKGLSYLHCEWATEEILASKDKRFSAKLKRFLQVSFTTLRKLFNTINMDSTFSIVFQ